MTFTVNAAFDPETMSAGNIRFDIFNNDVNQPAGTYVDIAYAGFFDSTESANEFYNAYLELYGLNAAE